MMWSKKWYYDILMFLKIHNIHPVDIFDKIIENCKKNKGKIGNLYRQFMNDYDELENFETFEKLEEYWKKEGITGILVGSDPFHGIGNISEATGYWEDVPEHEKMIDSPSETEPLINPDLYTPPEPLVHPDLYKPREPLIHPETKNPTGPYINVGSKLKQGIGSWLPFPGQGTVAAAALRANRSNNK